MPFDCDRFDLCNAPLCPLDPNWGESIWLNDEPICYYMRNAVRGRKTLVYTPLQGSLVPEAILSHYPRMHHQICASSST